MLSPRVALMYGRMGKPPNFLLFLAAPSVFSDFSLHVVLTVSDDLGLVVLWALLDFRLSAWFHSRAGIWAR